jgi:arylsulfatase A-like enzyme
VSIRGFRLHDSGTGGRAGRINFTELARTRLAFAGKFRPLISAMVLRLALLVAALAAGLSTAPAAPDRHVVVLVWDGMRPDFVSAETTPNLSQLAGSGVFFANHHPVYLSATEVNGTAIATGAYPSHSGLIANTDFRPAIDPTAPVDTGDPSIIRKGDEVSGGHFIALPTLAEILHSHGIATVIAGSKWIVLLHDRDRRPDGTESSPVLFQGTLLPPARQGTLAVLGDLPAAAPDENKTAQDAWTTNALLTVLWQNGVPPYTLLWLAEPDASQHAAGPGSAQALAAIKSSDANLGHVLAELDRRGLRATTDVLVVSDHGFSTIGRKVDVAAALAAAGFDAQRKMPGGLLPGGVMVAANGGSTLLYVGGHDAGVSRRLVEFLQKQDWTGVIFSRGPQEGAFPLAAAHIDAPDAPDLVVSLRWTADKSATGAPGLQVSDLKPTSVKAGNHASLSRYDMHNTLVAAGPDFRPGVTDPLPSANTDLAPTILWLLGCKDEAARMDGRVLAEALTVEGPPLKSFETRRLTAQRDTGAGVWRQYLQVSEVNGVRYLDEGNGVFEPK